MTIQNRTAQTPTIQILKKYLRDYILKSNMNLNKIQNTYIASYNLQANFCFFAKS